MRFTWSYRSQKACQTYNLESYAIWKISHLNLSEVWIKTMHWFVNPLIH